MRLTMLRSGEFTVKNPRDIVTQCGIEGRFHFVYDVYITNDGTLDPLGYIIENNLVHKYFTDTYESDSPTDIPSCEIIALNAVEGIKNLLEPKLNVNKIIVVIHGTPATHFEAEWERES